MELVRAPATYEERLVEVNAVSAADIQALAKRTFEPSLAVATLVGPVVEKDARRLELLLGREAQSTAWLSEDDDTDPPQLARAS
jgi:hypothetical protein